MHLIHRVARLCCTAWHRQRSCVTTDGPCGEPRLVSDETASGGADGHAGDRVPLRHGRRSVPVAFGPPRRRDGPLPGAEKQEGPARGTQAQPMGASAPGGSTTSLLEYRPRYQKRWHWHPLQPGASTGRSHASGPTTQARSSLLRALGLAHRPRSSVGLGGVQAVIRSGRHVPHEASSPRIEPPAAGHMGL